MNIEENSSENMGCNFYVLTQMGLGVQCVTKKEVKLKV